MKPLLIVALESPTPLMPVTNRELGYVGVTESGAAEAVEDAYIEPVAPGLSVLTPLNAANTAPNTVLAVEVSV